MMSAWWATRPPYVPVADTDRYEAFPTAVRMSDGRLVAAWASSDQHYATTSAAVASVSSDGGRTWSPKVTIAAPDGGVARWSAVTVAHMRGRIAALLMRPSPYSGYIKLTTDPVVWPAPMRQVDWASGSWTFPCHLAWLDDGSVDGLMLATCYGGAGVEVTASTDAGASWSRRGVAVAGTAYSEATITRLSGGELLMLVRWESGASREIRATRSYDLGYTWSAPETILERASGLPVCTVMPDGTLLATVRDMASDASPESWALGISTDQGVTWRVESISDRWMMYGQVVVLGATAALLVGASQDRGSSTNADVWALPLRLVDPGSAPIRVRGALDTICLTVPAGQTVSPEVSVDYPPRIYLGTPRVRARLLRAEAGASIEVTRVTQTGLSIRGEIASPNARPTYLPVLWSAEGN